MSTIERPIDLAGVSLSEGGATWLHAMPIGAIRHPVHGVLEFTAERLARFADNVRRRARGIDLDVDYDHKTDPAKGRKAAGWITSAEVRPDGLWIAVAFTDEARREIRAGHWRYLSPEFVEEWTDTSGQRWRDVLLGAGLTNRPFLKGLQPIAAHEPMAGSGSRFVRLVEKVAARTGLSFSEAAHEVSRLAPDVYEQHRRAQWG
jgi:phage I-like protein